MSTTLVWFRLDLRLDDHPALAAAVARGEPIIPVFIWAPEEEGPWQPGAASRWWLHQSLSALDADLRRLGSRLIVREGPTLTELEKLARETEASAVFWSRRYEPAVIQRDTTVKTALRAHGLRAESLNSSLLFEPWEIRTKQDRPYQVYTPFWRACNALPAPPKPLAAPDSLMSPARWPKSVPIAELGLEPKIDWASGMRQAWKPGQAGAQARLEGFLDRAIVGYRDNRDQPASDGTSALSPYLHFGEISPRTVFHSVRKKVGLPLPTGAEVFLKEVFWREFAYHLLYHFPATTDQPLRHEFAVFQWREDPKALRAWQKGQTGYPLVDAGMRQLWAAGWMHNRVRMVVASFLVKHLLLPWQAGTRWFWDTLVDADLASNTLGWQWTAGCGADAAPYFRIFNPVSQGEKFDAEADYIRQWVPELSRLPNAWIHKPWQAPPILLAEAGVKLGGTYPKPIVDHGDARTRALKALTTMRGTDERL